jgi:hypothetical protein
MTRMTSDVWERVQEVFTLARTAPPEQRAGVLDEACGEDAALRAEVVSLLQHADQAGEGFLEPRVRRPVDDDTVPAWAKSMLGRQLGRYTVVGLIGHGGMGCVFEARQERPARAVALKVLPPGFGGRTALARFRLEPEVLGRLQHPHIAQVYEAGVHQDEHGSVPYFAMELIPDAEPLGTYVDRAGLALRDRLALFAKVCDGVHHGHQKGVIHRDLKPGNILVGRDGAPKVIDFGVARSTDADILLTTQQTQAGDLVGTLRYMSPEQCDGDSGAIDTRSDVYALGVVLYELLTGASPYDIANATVYTAIRTIKEATPRPPGQVQRQLRGDLEAIVLKALEKEPARRYGSALELAGDLRRYLAGEPVTARAPSTAYIVGRWIQRRPWQALTGVATLLVVIFALVTALVWQAWGDAQAARHEADVRAYGAKISAVDAAIGVADMGTARELLRQAEVRWPTLCGWEFRPPETRLDQSVGAARPGIVPRVDIRVRRGASPCRRTDGLGSGGADGREPERVRGGRARNWSA